MTDQDTTIRLREVARARSRPAEADPAEPAPPHEKAGERPPETAGKPQDKGVDSYRRRVLLMLSSIALALALYWASSYFFAYTNDAYVTSDLVSVAPYISGRIIGVNILDNQTVRKGDLLATIDPAPFQLALNEKQAKKTEAEAQLAVDRDVITAAQAQRDDASAKERLASDNVRRATPITAAGFYSRQGLDTLTAKEQEAKAALADAEAAIAKAQQTLVLHQATVAAISAEIAYLQWQLEQTTLLAPTDGTITQLTLRVGDQAVANTPLIGLVDAHAWRIYANYKESVIRHMRVGHTAWVWLDAYPWHFHRAEIQGIARGISREQTERKLLPYVEPTTDWIRLERRFPVTLVVQDLSPDVVLHMGSDARAFVFY
ncbi:MAG: HlyD family secretion protein [Acetobacteraceae bacterium]|nr:HlyD family secretion protein [Acetobacteraceae bacterium]